MGKIIAVLVIMIVINLFMVFAVKKAANRVDVTIRKYFLDAVSGIDVLGENSGEAGVGTDVSKNHPVSSDESAVSFMTEDKGPSFESIKKESALYSSDSSVINYKNIDFKKEYKMVKSKMTLSKKEIIKDVINREEMLTDKNFNRVIDNIDNRFNFDMIYNLSTLSAENQITILRETLLNDEQEILDSFLKEECEGEFSCIDFFSYVEQLSYIYDSHYYVMTGWKTDNFENISDGVVMIYDENICEGIKIMHQNRLHDYSI